MRGAKPKADARRRKPKPPVEVVEAAAEIVDDGRRGVAMPDDIAADPVQKEIWEWVAPPVNAFTDADIPNLRLLVFWHAVAAQAQDALRTTTGKINAFDVTGAKAITGPNGETLPMFRKHPAVTVLKEASAEIRALSDQLGLSPLARSRIGLLEATTVKTAADTAAMFRSIDAAYGKLGGA